MIALIPAGRVSRSSSPTKLSLTAAPGATTTGVGSCAPSVLDRSALLDGAVTVSPMPYSKDASPQTQISMLGVPASSLTGVTVSGSHSGTHAGRLEPYSQGDGASFVPRRPFQPGETVSVHATLTQGSLSRALAYSFQVAVPDTFGEAGGSAMPTPQPSEYQHFRSRPELQPPTVTVSAHKAGTTPGELLLAPYSGPGQYGPMILGEDGSLLWFKPLYPRGARAADLRVQSYEGKQVLTWWQDPLDAGGVDASGVVIANEAYEPIDTVRASNGYQVDLHEFQITPQDTALITVYDGVDCNLSAIGGPADGAVADTLMQEIDLKTGLVRFEWHSLDHVPLLASEVSPRPGSRKEPFDFFHINSIDRMKEGNLLIDSRNTWAAYAVDPRTGQIAWRLGGKQSSFKLGPGAATAFQHDARQQPDGNITFFDNGATPKVHPQSRVIELALNMSTMTATLARRDEHSPSLLAGSQGNMQALSDGDWMVGWGQAPYLTEFDAAGETLFDAHLPSSYESYRVYRQQWHGHPSTRPAVAIATSRGRRTLYVSWNGATEVASWRVLASSAQSTLSPLASSVRKGFETAIALPRTLSAGAYVSVQALSGAGDVLGASVPKRA